MRWGGWKDVLWVRVGVRIGESLFTAPNCASPDHCITAWNLTGCLGTVTENRLINVHWGGWKDMYFGEGPWEVGVGESLFTTCNP